MSAASASRDQRLRESAYGMMPVEEAVGIVAAQARVMEAVGMDLAALARHPAVVLSRDVTAASALPPFRASVVDGYALRATGAAGTLPVAADVLAGGGDPAPLPDGHAVYITTGAPVPAGADACVKVEDTEGVADASGAEVKVTIKTAVQPGAWIRPVGSDIAAGQVVLRKGARVDAADVGLLAAVGCSKVPVHKPPVVGIMSTGNELVDPTAADAAPSRIRDSNRLMLIAAAHRAGAAVEDCGIVADDRSSVEEALASAVDRCDMVVTSGGVSMGSHDFVKPVLERLGTVHFGRLMMKPGKPATFATVPREGRAPCLVFALPGNPVSAMVCFNLLAEVGIRKMLGYPASELSLPRVRVTLQSDFRLDPERPEYHRAVVWASGDALVAESTGRQSSSRLLSMHRANALLCLPRRAGSMTRGSTVDAMLFGRVSQVPLEPREGAAPSSGCGGHHGHGHGGGGGGGCGGGHHGGHRHGGHHGHGGGPHGGADTHASHAPGECGGKGHKRPPVPVRAAILTTSDRVSRGEAEDRGTGAARKALEAIPGLALSVVDARVVPDEADEIRAALLEWCDSGIDLILTTGGTGFTPRDVTPEATASVIEKAAPGLVQAMLTEGLKATPLAILSRPCAGVRGNTLIINTPGSPKAIGESLTALHKVLPHALALAKKKDGAPQAAAPSAPWRLLFLGGALLAGAFLTGRRRRWRRA